MKQQTIIIGSEDTPHLPGELKALLEGSSEFISVSALWKSQPDFAADRAGTYVYTPEISSDYQIDAAAVLPSIRIKVIKANTTLSQLPGTLKKKSRQTLSQGITVSPAYGRPVQLQMYQNGQWVTKKTFTLSNSKSASLTADFPNDWWKVTSSAWRFFIPESKEGNALTSSSITVNTLRYYQNPSKYIQIQDKITLRHSGAYKLKVGYMGLKVQKVNRYFRIGNKYWPRYTSQTKRKVKAFQKRKKLKATGVVDKKTWMKMGFSESSWSSLGAYVSPIKVNPSSTKKDHIEAMISTAKKYLGTNYVVGASGKPGQGADCSGLVMQALYAAGVDPYPVSCVRHSKPGYEFESRNIWKNKKLKTVPYTKKQRGDLIFYRGRSGAINHIAIYLGGGKVIESWPNKVVIRPVKNSRRNRIKGVKRVFN
ncbi:NlpC/P60 family protein [Anaerovorax odorimutans]|uniref:NlpC/P60 family protein n=1 Tax=Anaerovorax odorimutans TaxID=109327 RepID=A0ABT1RKA5_9FIRM|nr:NlpC/P60 family protein [Anaerovorax odorimutans]